MLIILAPIIREKPVAIAKNETREETSRMVGKETKGTLQHEPDPAGFSSPFVIIRWPVPKKKDAHASALLALLMMN